MQVYLLRAKSDGKQTLGAWICQFLNEVFVAKTLELAWSNNASNISCIPVNDEKIPYYICKWTRSNSLSAKSVAAWLKANPGKAEKDCPEEVANIWTYEIFGVPDRAGIRLHSANFFFELRGCVALGDAHKDINMDNHLDAIHSGDTVKKFNELMNKQDFRLIVKNINEG